MPLSEGLDRSDAEVQGRGAWNHRSGVDHNGEPGGSKRLAGSLRLAWLTHRPVRVAQARWDRSVDQCRDRKLALLGLGQGGPGTDLLEVLVPRRPTGPPL